MDGKATKLWNSAYCVVRISIAHDSVRLCCIYNTSIIALIYQICICKFGAVSFICANWQLFKFSKISFRNNANWCRTEINPICYVQFVHSPRHGRRIIGGKNTIKFFYRTTVKVWHRESPLSSVIKM